VGSGPKCAECGYELDAAHDEPERRPCPRCGSTARAHSGEVRDEMTVEMSIKATVERGLNALRLAMFEILATIGLTVGFGVPGPWCVGVAAGIGSAMLAATPLHGAGPVTG
jgi:hypothetical protein